MRSPVCQPPLMNCTTAEGMPWAMQRRIMPKPELDLPLPGPVCTITNPFSPSFFSIMRSRAAFFFAIFAA